MITENQRAFIKTNRKVLSEIFTDKLAELKIQVFDGKREDRDKMIDALNVLRDWLREIEIMDKQKENKPDNFI